MDEIAEWATQTAAAIRAAGKAIVEDQKERGVYKCRCLCQRIPDLGSCETFVKGSGPRCSVCDHARECHPDFVRERSGSLPNRTAEKAEKKRVGRRKNGVK